MLMCWIEVFVKSMVWCGFDLLPKIKSSEMRERSMKVRMIAFKVTFKNKAQKRKVPAL